jgi:Aminotransferase class I and II/Acetyltransferase (GNAT) domain
MYGDCAPLKELVELLEQYKQFHLYIDDAHGMSIAGKNGTGYVLSHIALHPKMILATEMGKAFGTVGGIFVIPDVSLCQKVINCAGSLIFSGQHAIPVLGASIASAKIHLSDEIKIHQTSLTEKINYCHKLLKKHKLPDISSPNTPVFFVAVGLIAAGYNLVKRMMGEGYFVNMAVFPAVPETCTGVRFTITLKHSFEDIENLTEALAYHFPKVLEEEKYCLQDIQRAFRKVVDLTEILSDRTELRSTEQPYTVQHETTINNLSKSLWDNLMESHACFNWEGLKFLEQIFNNNPQKEHNWDFHYYIVRNHKGQPVLATFFTVTIIKDDALAPAHVSKQIEAKRLKDPYYLTSKTMLMGTPLTNGYLYINRLDLKWQDAIRLLLNSLMEEQEKVGINILYLRDFSPADKEVNDLLMGQGFVKIMLPDDHKMEIAEQQCEEEFLYGLNHAKRQYVKQQVINFEPFYEVEIISKDKTMDTRRWHELYENVRGKNLEVNSFGLPEKIFSGLSTHPDWEVIQLKLNSRYDDRQNKLPVAFMLCFKTACTYSPILIGMDYTYLKEYRIYPQVLWQTIKRGRQLNVKRISFGMTASQNKRKFGATAISKVAFVQMKDNYNATLINLMANKE